MSRSSDARGIASSSRAIGLIVFVGAVVLVSAVSAAPGPWLVAIGIYLFLTILILDAGAGVPIYFPLLRPWMKPYEPRPDYARLKVRHKNL